MRGRVDAWVFGTHFPYGRCTPYDEQDNGVKIVEPSGEMLTHAWEVWATELANAPDDAVGAAVAELVRSENITWTDQRPRVVVGRDTRCARTGPQRAREPGTVRSTAIGRS